MTIPIQNLYFLLIYAWDVLKEAELINISAEELSVPADLFAKMLIRGIDHLFRQGIYKEYILYNDSIYGIRGKINFGSSIKTLSLNYGKLVCEFDELSVDILPNRILKASICSLIKNEDLSKDLRKDLIDLRRRLADITNVKIYDQDFRKIQYHSNNRIYRYLLHVCKLIHDHFLPEQKTGHYRFREFTEKELEQVFENFLLNFYKLEQTRFMSVKPELFEWSQKEGEDESLRFLPKMKTDVSLLSDNQRIVIEAKFYETTLQSNFDVEKVHSNNMYQLFAYLQNLSSSDSQRESEGILVYPQIDKELSLEFKLHGKRIRICTVNLNSTPNEITSRLLNLIET
jgi:5-methylcytosine-specific restriction enzyme subunit McrC